MAYPYTENGYNMFDMLSLIQKSIRRSDYNHASFAAKQLKGRYRSTMWNRLFVTASEDCFGVLSKELVELRKCDEVHPSDKNLSDALALMCRAKKSRDACYFACNFVLANRKPRNFEFSESEMYGFHLQLNRIHDRIAGKINPDGCDQLSIEENGFKEADIDYCDLFCELSEGEAAVTYNGLALQKAMKHRDMDMIGYHTNFFRENCREKFWETLLDYTLTNARDLYSEIDALRICDEVVNKRRAPLDKDNIFVAKAVMLLCYYEDDRFDSVLSNKIVRFDKLIDWSQWDIPSIERARLVNGEIPEWVYDCHTLKGKKAGKTDWDMTVSEQAALTPLQPAYFDEASWLYTYEQDVEMGVLDDVGMKPILEFAKTHPVNPVEVIPYEE